MAIELTQRTLLAAKATVLRPQLVMSIDGLNTKFSSTQISEFIRVGDPGLFIDNYLGDPWVIGGLRPVEDQSDYISFGGGSGGDTTTRITQQVQIDKGTGTSVSQMTVTVIDKDDEISRLISPGFDVPEILGRSVTIEFGFDGTAYPEDFIVLFKGYIEDIESAAGTVKFSLSNPEQRKRQELLVLSSSDCTSAVSDTATTIPVAATENFLVGITGPNGSVDPDCTFYMRVGDEIIRYTGRSTSSGAGNITGCTRAQFNTVAAAYDAGEEFRPVVRLEGNPLDIARKLMLSGWNGPWKTGVTITNFNYVDPVTVVSNAIFFFGVDLERTYGLFKGDYISTTGAANAANNVTLKQILDIQVTNDGSYMIVDGVSFVNELDSAATISFRSKWDTLPFGCKMTPNDVDLEEWDEIFRLFLSGTEMDLFIEEPFEAKEYIERELLRPIAAYTIPRKGRVSIGYHTGPIPGSNIVTINQANIENAPRIKLRRSLSKNYYNTVIYKFDYDRLDDRPTTVRTFDDPTSIVDFSLGPRAMNIESRGLRTSGSGPSIALSASNRLLRRYKRAAEYFENVEVRFGDAFNLEIGDTVLLDTSDIRVTDTTEGNRSGNVRLFQIINKSMDIKAGKIGLSLVDTNIDVDARYALISPASFIRNVTSATVFDIESSFSSTFGNNEFLKWTRFLPNLSVRVRSPDGVTRNAVRDVASFAGNRVTLVSALPFTPVAGDLFEFSHYNDNSQQVILTYAHMRDTDPFDDNRPLYKQL